MHEREREGDIDERGCSVCPACDDSDLQGGEGQVPDQHTCAKDLRLETKKKQTLFNERVLSYTKGVEARTRRYIHEHGGEGEGLRVYTCGIHAGDMF